MKIISSKGLKDYYDYLQGIYGVDGKLILDRTEMSKDKRIPKENDFIRVYVCGYIVEGVYIDNDWRYGIELEKYHTDRNYFWVDNDDKNNYYNIVVSDYNRYVKILKTPFKITDDSKNPNLILDCPMLYNILGSWYFNTRFDKDELIKLDKYPILKDYNLHKVFTAEQIWLMLSEFLGREKNKIVNSQTDKEKIIGFGFDYKTSFRKM
jgi:hypothetical protein